MLVTASTKPSLAFNYRSEYNEIWRDPETVLRYGYGLRCPDDGEAGLAIVL